ncbi:MAG TPA: helix-turn-helix transcriptional regulator [Alphaproteobacteria bacterium]|nr:helix-turn-helix transcriptional regulator [Alphaproteobacteria bacterium]
MKSQLDVMMEVLRELLRQHGLRFADVARRLGVTERTVTRWFSADSVETAVLQRLCELIDIDFFALCEIAAKRVESRPMRHTLQQEQALAESPLLNYLFAQICKGWTAKELRDDIEIPEPVLIDHLLQLDKIGLIELLPGNEIRLKTSRDMLLIPNGPYARRLNQWLSETFKKPDVDEEKSVWVCDFMKLTPGSRERFERKFRALMHEAQELSDADRRAHAEDREWYGVVLVAKPQDIRPFAEWPAA